jgi:hypothetical protein
MAPVPADTSYRLTDYVRIDRPGSSTAAWVLTFKPLAADGTTAADEEDVVVALVTDVTITTDDIMRTYTLEEIRIVASGILDAVWNPAERKHKR